MIHLLVALLIPLHFTAPTDSLARSSNSAHLLPEAVHGYVFRQLDASGRLTLLMGYADPNGRVVLVPHAPGTPETVWLDAGNARAAVTIFILSIDRNGNLSAPSNGCVIGAASTRLARGARPSNRTALAVPLIRQARERCGPAALAMVLRYYGADAVALRQCDSAYDPVLRGSLITEMAGAARRAGFRATIVKLGPDSLIGLLHHGVPPIVLYEAGTGPRTTRQYGVVTGWDDTRSRFTLHNGSGRPVVASRGDLAKRWETAGYQALIVRRAEP